MNPSDCPITIVRPQKVFELCSESKSFSVFLCSTPSAVRRWKWQWNRWLLAERWLKEELSPTLIRWTSTRTFLNCRTIRDEELEEDLQKRTIISWQEVNLVCKWTVFNTDRHAKWVTVSFTETPLAGQEKGLKRWQNNTERVEIILV